MTRPCRRPAATTRVFAYGTLIAGEGNHHLLSRARFVTAARTAPEFQLHDLGAFPGLVAGGTQAVTGEVYEVDAATLAALDRLEGHPNFYVRTPITLADGAAVVTYLLAPAQVAGRPIIASGNWRTRRKGSHS